MAERNRYESAFGQPGAKPLKVGATARAVARQHGSTALNQESIARGVQIERNTAAEALRAQPKAARHMALKAIPRASAGRAPGVGVGRAHALTKATAQAAEIVEGGGKFGVKRALTNLGRLAKPFGGTVGISDFTPVKLIKKHASLARNRYEGGA